MRDKVSVPIRKVGSTQWGDLSAFASTHEFVGEKVEKINDNFSFAGQHRVRLYRFRKTVHWLIPHSVRLDISDVELPTTKPARRPSGKS